MKFEYGNRDFTNAIFNIKGDKYAIKTNCKRFDCGSKLGSIQANINFELKNKTIRKELLKYINEVRRNEI